MYHAKRLLRASFLALSIALSYGAHARADPPVLSTPAPWIGIGGVVSLAVTSTSASVQLGWVGQTTTAPLTANVCNTGSNAAFVLFGNSSVVSTATTGSQVLANSCRAIAINGSTFIAAITATSTTTLTIETGYGTAAAQGVNPNVGASSLLGNPTGSPADAIGITLGTNLSFSGTTLNAASSGGSVADPTAVVGLSPVNGTATSAIRSDGAPALDQGIAPTWTGAHTFAQPITSTFVSASALGAAIANAGSGGTDGATVLTVVGGTLALGGTAATFNATITGGVLDTTVPLTVASAGGPYTVVPSDPVSVTSNDAGPLTGATVNFGSGWNYAPAIVGSDPTKGIGLDQSGLPQLNNNGITRLLATADTDGLGDPGFSFESTNGFAYLVLQPSEGTKGQGSLYINGVGIDDSNANVPGIIITGANGVAGGGRLSPVRNGDKIGFLAYNGQVGPHIYDSQTSVELTAVAIQDFTASHAGVHFILETAALNESGVTERIGIDGSGNTNILNGDLIIGAEGVPQIIRAPDGTSGSGDAGNNLEIHGGTGDGTGSAGSGGLVSLAGGFAPAADGGVTLMMGGTSGVEFSTGALIEAFGGSAAGNGGNILLAPGGATHNGNGGTINIESGDGGSATGNAGDIIFSLGQSISTGIPGRLIVLNGPAVIGSTTSLVATAGDLAFAKVATAASAPGAGNIKMEWVAGTGTGTCKLISYAGTSATPVVLVDNVGTGC